MRNKILPYDPALKELARRLRKEGTLAEVLLWKQVRGKALGVEIHRQVPIDHFIVDFYCHELMLAIEIDGCSHDGEEACRRDAVRQQKIESYGVQFIRFSERDVRHNMRVVLQQLAGKVEMMVAHRASHPPDPLERGKY